MPRGPSRCRPVVSRAVPRPRPCPRPRRLPREGAGSVRANDEAAGERAPGPLSPVPPRRLHRVREHPEHGAACLFARQRLVPGATWRRLASERVSLALYPGHGLCIVAAAAWVKGCVSRRRSCCLAPLGHGGSGTNNKLLGSKLQASQLRHARSRRVPCHVHPVVARPRQDQPAHCGAGRQDQPAPQCAAGSGTAACTPSFAAPPAPPCPLGLPLSSPWPASSRPPLPPRPTAAGPSAATCARRTTRTPDFRVHRLGRHRLELAVP